MLPGQICWRDEKKQPFKISNLSWKPNGWRMKLAKREILIQKTHFKKEIDWIMRLCGMNLIRPFWLDYLLASGYFSCMCWNICKWLQCKKIELVWIFAWFGYHANLVCLMKPLKNQILWPSIVFFFTNKQQTTNARTHARTEKRSYGCCYF